jgi:drug/metabolite transporter (DMT)-like permease
LAVSCLPAPAPRRALALAQFKILLSAIGFGSMAILARFAYADGVSTPSLLFLRFFLAGLLLLPWVLWKKLPWPRGRALLVLMGMGSLGYAGMAACYFPACTMPAPAPSPCCSTCFPPSCWYCPPCCWASALAPTHAGTGAGAWRAGHHHRTGALRPAAGLLLGLASALIYSLYILAGSRYTSDCNPLTSACVVVFSAASCYGVYLAATGFHGPASLHGWLSVLGIACFGTVAALALFLSGLAETGATRPR